MDSQPAPPDFCTEDSPQPITGPRSTPEGSFNLGYPEELLDEAGRFAPNRVRPPAGTGAFLLTQEWPQ